MALYRMTPAELDYLNRLARNYDYELCKCNRPRYLDPILPMSPDLSEKFKHCSYGTPTPFAVTIPPKEGVITYSPMNGATYGISDNFTGCMMAQFKYNDQSYIAHIYLDRKTPSYDTRNVWNDFIDNCCRSNQDPKAPHFSDFVMFKPSDVFGINYLLQYYKLDGCFFGIIDSYMNCYTGILYKPKLRFAELKTETHPIIVLGHINSSNANQLKIL